MSGIIGIIDYKNDLRLKKGTLEKMSASIFHRGEKEYLFNSPYSLLGLRKGSSSTACTIKRQIAGEKYTVLIDGNILNESELIDKYIQKTTINFADTILELYLTLGEKFLPLLDGVFVLAIFSSGQKKLLLARDKVGIRPLYYAKIDGGLCFGSEIKAIFESGLVYPTLDQNSLNTIFLLGPAKPKDSGVYKGISELCGGEFITLKKDGFKKKTYFKLENRECSDTACDAKEKLYYLIKSATDKFISCNSYPSSLLSGGLDSSIISFLASSKLALYSKKLSTISIDFLENDKNFIPTSFQPTRDSDFVSIMSDKIGSFHREIKLDTFSLYKSIISASIARDLPCMADIDSSMLLVANQLKNDTNAVFSGECADELFGGYPWYQDNEKLFQNGFAWSNSLALRTSIIRKSILTNSPSEFVYSHYNKTISEIAHLDSDSKLERRIKEMFLLNYNWFMRTLLDRAERMSAVSGVEVIVPFADSKIVEYAFNLPWSIKNLHGKEKGILRDAFKGVLPQQIIYRKKSPFPKSFDPEFVELVKGGVLEVLSDKTSVLSDILDHNAINFLLNEPSPLSKPPWFGQLMRLPQVFGYLIALDALFKRYNPKIK